MKAKRFSTYPLWQDVPNSSELVLFLKWVDIVLFSHSVVPFTLKAAEHRVSALQPS